VAGALVEYAYGELEDEKDRDRVEAHLGGCASCQADVLQYRMVLRLAARVPPLPLPPRLLDRLRSALLENP
jgi:hypothetical protein